MGAAGVRQLPLPSQYVCEVKSPAWQDAPIQPALAGRGLHAPEPLQVPSLEQKLAPAGLATHRPFGSAVPEATGKQLPAMAPGTLQLRHRPVAGSSLHALSQQIPSVQWPLTHSALPVQAVPLGLSPHVLLMQVYGTTQSALETQLDLQVVGPQLKLPQESASGVTQAPAPSQVDGGVSSELVAHSATLQFTPCATKAHSPPLQAPVLPQDAVGVDLHTPWGSGEPSATGLHRPAEAARLHAMQALVQVELQQTPCAQLPDTHSDPVPHSAPSGFRPHEPLLVSQTLGDAHCELSLVQAL